MRDPAQTTKTLVDFCEDLPRPGVMCTLIQVTGSHPQAVGARMWVSRAEVVGTLGGGAFERDVMGHALEQFRDAAPAPHIEEYVLSRRTGQCCGGRARVFYEFVPSLQTIHLFGGGHVGSAVSRVLCELPYRVCVIDPRPEWSTARDWPAGVSVFGIDPTSYVRERTFGPNDAACIFTHDHELDFAIVAELLPTDIGYLGLIGSDHKARRFRARLAELDLVDRWDETMNCPIGAALPDKNPRVIAIAIAEEVLRTWALVRPPIRSNPGATNLER
jgi:xanthine dehydrogenase accessory factor